MPRVLNQKKPLGGSDPSPALAEAQEGMIASIVHTQSCARFA